jgi:anti-sigma regulatory factor (Ser/Thr protein kinase)
VSSEPGNERQAIDRVAEAVAGLGLAGERLERLKTAVGEATMNAIEHGNGNRPELPVEVRVVADETDVKVRITDQGGERAIPEVEAPDLEAKLAGLQTPRGWGLFLIQNMVDGLETAVNEHHHTIELVMHLKEVPDARS